MRKAARVIVIHENNLLVMHRNKFGTEYDTLPGGAVEMGEEPAATAVREVREETSVEVADLRPVFIEHAGDMYGDQYIYVARYVSGEPALSPDSIERSIHQMGKNLYEPRWLPLDKLPEAPFLSEELKQKILSCSQAGWPEEVEEFSSQRRI